jgi:hypothetical protein
MKLIDALAEVESKEGEGRRRLAAARRKGDKIKYSGEVEATELYRRTRGGLKDKVISYREGWEKKLARLEDELKKKRGIEEKKLRAAAGARKGRAVDAAYAMLVDADEGSA